MLKIIMMNKLKNFFKKDEEDYEEVEYGYSLDFEVNRYHVLLFVITFILFYYLIL